MTQQEALEHLKGDKNIFLSGPPGSGKSYLIRKYIEWLVDNGEMPAITASTGIAALNLNGRTLHSWAGIRNDEALSTDDFREIVNSYYVKKRIESTKILIIDEISMVSPRLLDIVNSIATHIKGKDEPFGGIKVVLVGDFFQLPPVSRLKEPEYAFHSNTWDMLDMKVCYLHEQHRTNDIVFTNILSGIRTNTLTEDQKQILRNRIVSDVSTIDAIRLDTHNEKVDKINDMKLRMHEGVPKTYVMSTKGDEKLIQGLVKSCMSPERLTLKVGVPVLFTKNDRDLRWVNGTRGIVTYLGDECIKVQIHGVEYDVERETWSLTTGYGKYAKEHATLVQYPLRVAWAITIHKSQGMTLDSAIIDGTNAFACGHGYVAVSRVRSLDGLFFQGKLTRGMFMVDERVQEFDKKIQS